MRYFIEVFPWPILFSQMKTHEIYTNGIDFKKYLFLKLCLVQVQCSEHYYRFRLTDLEQIFACYSNPI